MSSSFPSTRLHDRVLWRSAILKVPRIVAVDPLLVLAKLVGMDYKEAKLAYKSEIDTPVEISRKLKLITSPHGFTFMKLRAVQLEIDGTMTWPKQF